MTTAQESTNGHHHSPLPCSFPDSQQQNQSKDSTNNNSSSVAARPQPEAFTASAYRVPPKLYAPKADSFHDTIPDGLSTMKLPDRCQFMFSDGRQCKMARSDIHPSLCPYHSEREEQLFGAPHTRGSVRGPSFDLPELFSASRDLTTAAGVNRALGQVFRLLAQRRISRQEAATFAKLAHLLLQSIRAARAETAAFATEEQLPMIPVVEREKAVANTALFTHKEAQLRGAKEVITPLLPHNQVLSPVNNFQRDRSAQTPSAAANSPAPPSAPAAPPAPSPARTVVNNSSEINRYKNVDLNPLQNQHLQEDRSEHLPCEIHPRREHQGDQELRGVNRVGALHS